MPTERASAPYERFCCSCCLQLVRPIMQTPCGDRICGRCLSDKMACLRYAIARMYDGIPARCPVIVVFRICTKLCINLYLYTVFPFSDNQPSETVQCMTCLTQVYLTDVSTGVLP